MFFAATTGGSANFTTGAGIFCQRSSGCLFQCDGGRGHRVVNFHSRGGGSWSRCCPLSEIRNHAAAVSELLVLPDLVFPLAGLALGWQAEEGEISLRLPLGATLHRDAYSDDNLKESVAAYDRRRAAQQPYSTQRHVDEFGIHLDYGWSEDKARQYARPEAGPILAPLCGPRDSRWTNRRGGTGSCRNSCSILPTPCVPGVGDLRRWRRLFKSGMVRSCRSTSSSAGWLRVIASP